MRFREFHYAGSSSRLRINLNHVIAYYPNEGRLTWIHISEMGKVLVEEDYDTVFKMIEIKV